MKYIIRMLFYEIPKDILSNGKWDLVDHKETIYINLYQHHEEYTYYSKVSHIIALIFLNFLSFFSFEVALSRSIFLFGVLKSIIKWGKSNG